MEGLEEARRRYFFENSQNRKLRRRMAKKLGYMKQGWQTIKDEFPPLNRPQDLGVKEFKRVLKEKPLSTSVKNKAVLQYKLKAREALVNTIKSKEA